MRTRPLGRTGIEVSELGLGCSGLGEEFGRIDPVAAMKVVPRAIEVGINLFDTSPYYGRGRSEVALGWALRGIPREKYVLCTKVGRYDVDKFDFSAQRVVESVDVSLHRLGTDHIDLILCHDVEFADLDQIVDEAIPTLRDLQARGKVRAVGISGYPMKVFTEVSSRTTIDFIMSYGSLALHNRRLQGVLPTLHERGVGVLNASPFDMGLLTNTDLMDWHPSTSEQREAAARARALCTERGTDIAKVAFQFAANAEGPASLLTGTAFTDQIDEWIEWLAEPINEALLAELDRIFDPVMNLGRIMGRTENN